MELLVYKAGNQYLRIQENGYELTGINKASVYPASEIETVKERYNRLKILIPGLLIRKLIITETDYT